MEVTRYDEAPSYEAPGHFDVYGLRLQGFEVTKTRTFSVSISHFLPAAGASTAPPRSRRCTSCSRAK